MGGGVKWSEAQREHDYTGNESRSWDVRSIYMHYAMVVMPTKRSEEV